MEKGIRIFLKFCARVFLRFVTQHYIIFVLEAISMKNQINVYELNYPYFNIM